MLPSGSFVQRTPAGSIQPPRCLHPKKGMIRRWAYLALAMLVPLDGIPNTEKSAVLSVCDLSKDLPRYRGKLVTVRGVYYYGLRQSDCPQKCDTGLWPSFLDLKEGQKRIGVH